MQHLQTVASWIKALDVSDGEMLRPLFTHTAAAAQVDVLNLAEVEDCNVLRMLIDAIGDTSYKVGDLCLRVSCGVSWQSTTQRLSLKANV